MTSFLIDMPFMANSCSIYSLPCQSPSIGRNVSLAHSTRTQPANEKKKIFTINLPNVALQKAISIKLVFLMPQRAYRKTVRQLEPTHTQARARHNVDKMLLLLQRFCCCYFMFFSQFFFFFNLLVPLPLMRE